MNIGVMNKKFLIDSLTKRFEQEIDKIKGDKFFHHDFTRVKPIFEITLRVTSDEVEVLALRDEVEALKKRIQRMEKRHANEVEVDMSDLCVGQSCIGL